MKQTIAMTIEAIMLGRIAYTISLPEPTIEERLNKIGDYELSHYIKSD